MFTQPDLEKPYQDACNQAEREEERIEQMADWIAYELKYDHRACSDFVDDLADPRELLANIIGIIMRAEPQRGHSSSVEAMALKLINVHLEPLLRARAERRAACH
jgi:hypothetical protein